jgi:hypothetical protein
MFKEARGSDYRLRFFLDGESVQESGTFARLASDFERSFSLRE